MRYIFESYNRKDIANLCKNIRSKAISTECILDTLDLDKINDLADYCFLCRAEMISFSQSYRRTRQTNRLCDGLLDEISEARYLASVELDKAVAVARALKLNLKIK